MYCVSEYVNTRNKVIIPDHLEYVRLRPYKTNCFAGSPVKEPSKGLRFERFGDWKLLNNTWTKQTKPCLQVSLFRTFRLRNNPGGSRVGSRVPAESRGFFRGAVIFWWPFFGEILKIWGWFPLSQKSSPGHFFMKDSSKLKLPLLTVGPLFLLPSSNTKTRW